MASPTKYQEVVTATNYALTAEDGTPFPVFLIFDGTDDGMVTNSIDFSATDKMSVFAGVRKLSDAARGMVVELTTGTTNSFQLNAPSSPTTDQYLWGSQGSGSVSTAKVTSGYLAPTTNVLTGLGNISGDSAILRINGTQAASSPADQGTGNYANASLYIGRRGGSTLPFNGRLYSLIVTGKLASAAEIASTENWVEAKTFGKDMNYVYSDEVLTAASEQITTADGQNVYMTVTYQ